MTRRKNTEQSSSMRLWKARGKGVGAEYAPLVRSTFGPFDCFSKHSDIPRFPSICSNNTLRMFEFAILSRCAFDITKPWALPRIHRRNRHHGRVPAGAHGANRFHRAPALRRLMPSEGRGVGSQRVCNKRQLSSPQSIQEFSHREWWPPQSLPHGGSGADKGAWG